MEEVGTTELHQLEPIFQSVLVAPLHVPAMQDAVIFKIPVAVVPK